MNLQTYQQRIAEFGIDRGQLAHGFMDIGGGGSMHYDIDRSKDWSKSKRPTPPDVDCKKFRKKPCFKPMSKESRIKHLESRAREHINVAFYRHLILTDREPKELAKQIGINVTSFYRAINGYASEALKAKIAGILTPQERKLANMK